MSGPFLPDSGSVSIGSTRSIRGPHLLVAIPPPAKSALNIRDLIRIESPKPRPNVWRRFWHWFLLGWTWEKL
jgi:hypothetical protein